VSQTCFNNGISTLPLSCDPVTWKDEIYLKEVLMLLFLIECNLSQKLQVTPERAGEINAINAEEKASWLISFL
jgi:hypothetical protein